MESIRAAGLGRKEIVSIVVGVSTTIFFGLSVGVSGARAEPPPRATVLLGEVSTTVSSSHVPDAAVRLRQALETELGALDWARSKPKRKRATLSASLNRLESVPEPGEGHHVRISCTVSATLRDDGGALLAVVEGRARVDEANDHALAAAERDVLAAAAHTAVGRIPEALERVP